MREEKITSPLIVLQRHPLLKSWVERNGVGTLLVEMSKDKFPHFRVECPDTRCHHCNGECCFMVRGHFLLTLFLGTQIWTQFQVNIPARLNTAHQFLLPIPLTTRFLTTNFSASLYWTKSNPCGLRVTDTERPPDWTGFPESRLWIFSKTSFSFEPGWERKSNKKIKLQVDMIVHTYTNASIWEGG